MKIYTTFGKQKTIREFIKLFFNNVYSDRRTNVTTFFDENCTQIQCNKGKFRSFDDIYDCVKTYYKSVTPKQLIRILITTDLKSSTNQQLYFHMSTCGGIQRQRCLFYSNTYNANTFTCNQYNSKWSWKELLLMLGVNNQEELIAYTNKHKK